MYIKNLSFVIVNNTNIKFNNYKKKQIEFFNQLTINKIDFIIRIQFCVFFFFSFFI